MDKPEEMIEDSTDEHVALIKDWDKSNRLSLMFMRMTIAKNIKTSLPRMDNALELLKAIKECFKYADKSLARTIMADLTTIKYDGNK